MKSILWNTSTKTLIEKIHMSKLIPSDGPKVMTAWIVKTDDKEDPVKVINAKYARKEDEIYMFCDGAKVFKPKRGFRRTKGIFLQLRRGENYRGPFKSLASASAWADKELNG